VFSLNDDGAPCPDVYGAFCYQTLWEIVKNDVYKPVLKFFQSRRMMPNFNANTLVLILKIPNADSMEHHRPIAMALVKYKIIPKVLADILASIISNLFWKEQRGFVEDTKLRDCVCLTLDVINLLQNKAYGGNITLKIDISKAFDTLEWSFLLRVLKRFGFNPTFYNWIDSILNSIFLSASINRRQQGCFNCKRRVGQRDPLSPLIFCLVEEVLSIRIPKLVINGKLNHIKASGNINVHSRTLYANDIMFFCRGNINGLINLKQLLYI